MISNSNMKIYELTFHPNNKKILMLILFIDILNQNKYITGNCDMRSMLGTLRHSFSSSSMFLISFKNGSKLVDTGI